MPTTAKFRKVRAEYVRTRYANNPEFREAQKKRVKATRVRWTKKNRLLLEEAKRVGCACCPERAACCLVFHHLDPKKKDERVSQLVGHGSPYKLLKEMAKCIVLCANCHMKHHAGLINLPT